VSVVTFLEELRSRDIQVWQDGGQLRCNAPSGVLTPDLRDALRQRKGDIVEFLRSAEAFARQQRAIVPLQQQGSRTPVFAVPGHNGDVFLYRALAQHLGDDQPFFGLQPPGLDGHSEPLQSVDDLAAYFAAQIRAFRPNGPYIIAGYCAGGTIAYELARQLLQQGASISFVIMFAGAHPMWYRFLPQQWERIALRAKRLRKHVVALASGSYRESRLYITEKLGRRADANRLAGPDPILTLRGRLKQITAAAVRRYEPRDFAGRLCQVVPSKSCVISGDPMLLWRKVAPHMEEYYGPDGCEGDIMLLEPHVRPFAEVFRVCRDA
jgi:thioesterase domain-containing protein